MAGLSRARALSRGNPVDGARIRFRDAEGAWQIALAGLPADPAATGILSLLPPQRLVLVLVTDLTSGSNGAVDASALSLAFGLTPAEAISAATRNGALLLRVDSLGLVAPGKVADLVILKRDPLADIRNTLAIERVMSRGRMLSPDSIRAGW